MTIRSILTPTDFSTCADRALEYALAIARRFDAKLHLLHVANDLDPDWYDGADSDGRAESLRDLIRGEAQQRMASLVGDVAPVEAQTAVVQQRRDGIAEVISDYLDDHAIDLTVLGTHGRRGLRRLVLGSVATRVVRQSSRPVMTVRETESPRTRSGEDLFQDILAPIDFSEPSREALRYAKALASRYGARVHLLFIAEKRVLPTFSDTGLPGIGVVEMDPDIVRNARDGLQQLDEHVGGADVERTYHVQKGDVAEEIVEYAEMNGIDLTVMARRGLADRSRVLLGSTTERVVRAATSPVLTLPTTAQVPEDD